MRRAVLVTSVLCAGVVVAPAPARGVCPSPIPVVAHRGGTERYAENTLKAFRDARNRGAMTWETDVRATAPSPGIPDGVQVLMHDPTVDRTTDGTGAVADLTYPQVAGMLTADGQRVPTLADLLSGAAVDGVRVLLELKYDPTGAQWADIMNAVAGEGMAAKTVLMSFDPAVVAEAVEATAGTLITVGLVENPGYRPVADYTAMGVTWLVKHQDSITGARLDEWSGPVNVAAWTVDTVEGWTRMNYYTGEPGRLDAVITNKPAAYAAWARARVC